MNSRTGSRQYWEVLEDKLASLSETRYGIYTPEARLAVAVIVSAGKDGDRDFLENDEFTFYCHLARLHQEPVKALIEKTWEHIVGGRTADFEYDFDETLGI